MAKDRAKDVRRTVGSHEKMMGALGRAAGWERDEFLGNKPAHVNEKTGEIQNFTPGAGHVKTGKALRETYWNSSGFASDNKMPNPVENIQKGDMY